MVLRELGLRITYKILIVKVCIRNGRKTKTK